MDGVVTFMIAGRLVYLHRARGRGRDRGNFRLGGGDREKDNDNDNDKGRGRGRGKKNNNYNLFQPIITIFIESVVLSTISKIIQLSASASGSSFALSSNPVVIPLCVSGVRKLKLVG